MAQNRSVPRWVIRVCTATLLMSFLAATHALSTSSAAADEAGTSSSCSPLSLFGEYYENPDTHSVNSSDIAGDATVIGYAPKGASRAEITVNVPPSSWTPIGATSAELAFYGIPTAQESSESSASWTSEWSNFTSPAPTGMCISSDYNSAAISSPGSVTSDATDCVSSPTSANWEGVLDCGSGYTEMYGSVTVPSTEYCPGSYASTHSMWVGLGGWTGTTGLLQNGIEQANDPPTNQYWYQAIDVTDGYNTNLIEPTGSNHPSVGDTVHLSTTYDPNTAPPTAIFSFHDLTSGFDQQYSEAYFTDYATKATFYASQAYDGSSAEAVDERTNTPAVTFPYLRDFGTDDWSLVQVADNGGSLSPWRNQSEHTGFDMLDYTYNAQNTQTPPEENFAQSSASGTENFDGEWANCGLYGRS